MVIVVNTTWLESSIVLVVRHQRSMQHGFGEGVLAAMLFACGLCSLWLGCRRLLSRPGAHLASTNDCLRGSDLTDLQFPQPADKLPSEPIQQSTPSHRSARVPVGDEGVGGGKHPVLQRQLLVLCGGDPTCHRSVSLVSLERSR